MTPPPRLCRAIGSTVFAAVVSIAVASAAERNIYPGDSFEAAVESLSPGDTLTVHPGTYVDSGRIGIRVKGTATAPVLIRRAPGKERPLITRSPNDRPQNTINIEGGEHITIRGLEISSNGGDGINMSRDPSYITLEDLVIHDISVGINFRSSMHHIVVRRNRIYATNDTGEGMYIGCNYAKCAVSDSVIEGNWIHDTGNASQGDGIEVKRGSHSNVIRHNVIHDTNYPCILLYGTEGNPKNIVDGNVMWNCGDSGIQVAADAVIQNNIILGGTLNGLNSQPHQGVSPNRLTVVHNTVVGGNPCLRMMDWENKREMVFANNAIYCTSGVFRVGRLDGVVASGNVFWPSSSRFPDSGNRLGRSEARDFVDAAGRNVYPSNDSALLDAANPGHSVPRDFNDVERKGRVDAGAYTWSGTSNPGWRIVPGFKKLPGESTLATTGEPPEKER